MSVSHEINNVDYCRGTVENMEYGYKSVYMSYRFRPIFLTFVFFTYILNSPW